MSERAADIDGGGRNRMIRRIYTTERTGDKTAFAFFNVVEEVHDRTMDDAIAMLDRLPKEFCRASAILFHNVCPTRKTDIDLDIDWAYIEGEMADVALKQSLETLEDKKLYRTINIKGWTSDANRVFESGRPLCLGTGSCFPEKNVTSQYIEDVMKQVTKKGHNLLYYYNSVWIPRGYTSVLQNIKSHLSSSINPDIGDCPGINSPMFYVGHANSYTPMHVEDGLADGINVLHDGHPKLWFIVESTNYGKLNACLRKSLDTVESYPDRHCPLSVCHRDLLITPKYLDENNIRYSLIVQKPGDMIYVRKCVPHQVINIGKNIAEAINYGSHEWNLVNDNDSLKMCSCGRNAITPLVSNHSVQWSVHMRLETKVFKCDECDDEFDGAVALKSHKLAAHKPKYVCPYCAAEFSSHSSMSRHCKYQHAAGLRHMRNMIAIPEEDPDDVGNVARSPVGMRKRNRETCDICKKKYIYLATHMRTKHGRLHRCEFCNAEFTLYDLRAHQMESNCTQKCGCNGCGRVYASQRSLRQHIRLMKCV